VGHGGFGEVTSIAGLKIDRQPRQEKEVMREGEQLDSDTYAVWPVCLGMDQQKNELRYLLNYFLEV